MPPRPTAALLVVLAAALLALPACKKSKPTKQDSDPGTVPPGTPGPMPMPGPGTGAPSDPSLPSPPSAPRYGATAAPQRAESQQHLKQIALALANAEATYGSFPIGIADKSGKIGLSWRVAILPYIEQENLYRQFKLDEPWDSAHNKTLIQYMPRTYRPGKNTDTNGYTYYCSFSGPGAFLPPPPQGLRAGQVVMGLRPLSITDGTSNTFMVVEAADPVVWTKPDDIPFAPGKPPRVGGSVFSNGFNAAFCDLSTRFFTSSSLDATTLERLIQTNDGNPVTLP